jgi:hypothetical protein
MTGEARPRASRPPLTVLYITGWCRNGSTLIGNILNEVSGFFHTGELYFLWRNAYGDGSNSSCGCGEELVRCPVWSKVIAAEVPPRRPAEAHAREIVRRQLASVRTRHTWRVLKRGAHSRALREHAAMMSRAYRAVADVTGCRTIVDSGKLPVEAALLPHVDGISPRYLHLMRDPRAIAHSWTKTKQYVVPMSARRSTAYWLGFHLASGAVLRRDPGRSMFLRYEDFIAQPARWVDRLLELAGADRSANPVRGRDVVLDRNHTVTGNPDRFHRGPTLIRADDGAWRTQLSSRDVAVTQALSWPLMRQYGYPTSRRNANGSGTRE